MKEIINRAKKHPYHSMQYVEPEDPITTFEADNYILIVEDQGIDLKIHWACENQESLIDGLNSLVSNYKGKEITLAFVPAEFVQALENIGYHVKSEFTDFWIKDWDQVDLNKAMTADIRPLRKDEVAQASDVTLACKNLSRGFDGENEASIQEWLDGENNQIFAAHLNQEIVGICMMATYKKKDQTVAWLRELAVHPNHQRQGIARSLAITGLKWGETHGASLSFLATDVENTPAINLYKELGYQQARGRGEINIHKIL